MRASWSVLLAVLLGLGVTIPSALPELRAAGARARSDVMPLSRVRTGMKGYGLTVFQGTRPERFDVEVIDVLKGFLPKQDLILVKTRHPRLDVARVVAGMSGSPVFVDGKMIGAYAYGWTFSTESVAGLTPIENMLSDLDRPLPAEIYGWPLGLRTGNAPSRPSRSKADAPSSQTRYSGDINRYDLGQHAAQLRDQRQLGSEGQLAKPVMTPLLLGGLSPAALETAARLLSPLGFEPLQAGGGGGGEADAPTRYEDGGALGVQLIRGDVSAMGLGTVTRVEGDRLVAFGHPMMQSGVTALPTAIGRVAWFLASEMRSFKLGTPARPLGALVADRQASVVVSQSTQAKVIPVVLTIEGMDGSEVSTWKFEIAHEKFLTPVFLSMAIGSAIQSVAAEKRDVTWQLDSTLRIQGQPELTLQDFGVAVGGTPGPNEVLGWSLVEAVGAAMNNPWEPALIDGVTGRLKLRFAREVYRLRGAEVLQRQLAPGEPARVRLTLVPYEGVTRREVIAVPLPNYLAGERVALELVPGYAEELEQAPAENLAELLHNLDEPQYPPRSVVVRCAISGDTLAYHGRVAANLPAGVVDTLLSTSSTVTPRAYSGTLRTIHELPFYVIGREKVSVDIRPPLR